MYKRQVHYGRKGRSKRHVTSTPINKEGRDKPGSTVAENSRPTKEFVSRDGCRRHQVCYDQGGDSQRGFAEHSSEDSSVESDTASTEDDDSVDGSRQARGGHPHRTVYSQRHGRRTSHRRRFDHKGSWMKPEKFNGHGSFETFLVQFENCCRYNDWNRKDKAAHRSKVAGATYLRARINGRMCDCLLDTGSDVTLIPISFVNVNVNFVLIRRSANQSKCLLLLMVRRLQY